MSEQQPEKSTEAPKKKPGRPPGSGKKAAAKKTTAKKTAAKKPGRPPGSGKKAVAPQTAAEKRAATKAANEMLKDTSAPTVSGEQVLAQIGAKLNSLNQEARARQLPVIEGDATVTLHLHVPDAEDPLLAVTMATQQIAQNGLRNFVFLVEDHDEGAVHAVKDGALVDLDSLR